MADISLVNIDAIARRGKLKLQEKRAKVYDGSILYKSSDGKVIGTQIKKETPKDDLSIPKVIAKDIKVEPVKSNEVKVYKNINVPDNFTLRDVAEDVFNKYPSTKKYYSKSQLINVIVRDNNLINLPGNLSKIYQLSVPVYLPVKQQEQKSIEQIKEEIEKLGEYQEHYVTKGEFTIYQIIANQGYETTDNDEINRLIQIIKDINRINVPTNQSTILIPNVQRYNLEQELKKREEQETKTR